MTISSCYEKRKTPNSFSTGQTKWNRNMKTVFKKQFPMTLQNFFSPSHFYPNALPPLSPLHVPSVYTEGKQQSFLFFRWELGVTLVNEAELISLSWPSGQRALCLILWYLLNFPVLQQCLWTLIRFWGWKRKWWGVVHIHSCWGHLQLPPRQSTQGGSPGRAKAIVSFHLCLHVCFKASVLTSWDISSRSSFL